MRAMAASASPCEMSFSAVSEAQVRRKAAATIAPPKMSTRLYVPLDGHHTGEIQGAEDDGGGGESGQGRYQEPALEGSSVLHGAIRWKWGGPRPTNRGGSRSRTRGESHPGP